VDKFSIAVDPATAFVRIKLRGLLTVADVAEFANAQLAAYAGLAAAQGRHRTLCDVSECKIQLQEVVQAFRQLLADERLMSSRMAFVVGKSPARMQIRRLILRETCRFFETAAEAERWLQSDPCPSATEQMMIGAQAAGAPSLATERAVA
jgi:hypothetical protein